ncbi:MAG: GtrA family protein [bacterium]
MNSFLKQFTQREAGPLVQFIKYGICGATAVFVLTISFYILGTVAFPAVTPKDEAAGFLMWLGLPVTELDDSVRSLNYGICQAIGFMIANFIAYILNVMWVFKPGRHSRFVEILMFYAVSGLSMAIGSGFAILLINRYSWSSSTAFIANIIASTLINYAMRKFVIFKG